MNLELLAKRKKQSISMEQLWGPCINKNGSAKEWVKAANSVKVVCIITTFPFRCPSSA